MSDLEKLKNIQKQSVGDEPVVLDSGMGENTILSVQDLHTSFKTDNGEVSAVNGISFNLDRGKTLGIVGESGSGKSVTAYSIMRILAENGYVKSGKILYNGENILDWSKKRCVNSGERRYPLSFRIP